VETVAKCEEFQGRKRKRQMGILRKVRRMKKCNISKYRRMSSLSTYTSMCGKNNIHNTK
jgi:hypothetical protein